MTTTASAPPFKPVSKPDAAALLGVSTKTIDNYIRAGLLPPPRPFGGRELWHPDCFFAVLRDALMTPASAVQAPAASEDGPTLCSVVASKRARRGSEMDSSAMVRQQQRQAELLGRLNDPSKQ